MNRKAILLNLAAVSVLCSAIALAQEAAATRPEKWARPMNTEGVPNFFQVSSNLYRCAQPDNNALKAIEKLGIKTVINLRGFHTDKDAAAGTSMKNIPIPMMTWKPSEDHVVAFLKTVTDEKNWPVLVHCQHGADRTGTMCAVYRIAVQGWSKEDAIAEMTGGGYGFHSVWDNLIDFIKNLDIDTVKKKAGIDIKPSEDKQPETKKD